MISILKIKMNIKIYLNKQTPNKDFFKNIKKVRLQKLF